MWDDGLLENIVGAFFVAKPDSEDRLGAIGYAPMR